jgi:methionyl-tRNA formyltransferase
MRIIFAGTPTNAALTLRALVHGGFDVVGVLTRQDARVGRGKEIVSTPVAAAAVEFGLEIMKANSISPEVQAWIDEKAADLGVIVAYGCILDEAALESPVRGWINLHYSLLPEFPGAAPVQHAILEGKTVTGVTVFRLDKGIDTGPILSSREMPIDPDATSGELLSELASVGSELLLTTLNNLEESFASQKQQPKLNAGKRAGKLNRAVARIDFSNPAIAVHNFVRAMNPEPIAWFELDDVHVRALSTRVSEVQELSVGELGLYLGELLVGCGTGAVALLRVQPSGKNAMSGADWFRGLRQQAARIS